MASAWARNGPVCRIDAAVLKNLGPFTHDFYLQSFSLFFKPSIFLCIKYSFNLDRTLFLAFWCIGNAAPGNDLSCAQGKDNTGKK